MLCGIHRARKAPKAVAGFVRHGALMTAIKVPQLGESIVEATVSRWLKNEGDQVAEGDNLVDLETDKITVEVPALASGVLTKRAVNEGDVVTVDQLLGEIAEGAAASAPAKAAAAPAASSAPAAAAPTPAPSSAPSAPPRTRSHQVYPAARREYAGA